MNGSNGGRRTARVRGEDKVRVAIIGVGNCANSLLQGVEYYKDAPDDQFVPGLMHVEPRRLPRPRRRVRRRVRRDQGQGRQGPRRRDLGAPERHDQVRRRAEDGHQGLARHDARRHRQVPLAGRREGARRDRRRRRDPQGAQRRRRRQLPPRRLGDGDEVVRRADPRRRLRDGELHAGLHRARAVLAAPLRAGRACRSSATTSSRRSARRSRTACSRRSSASAACTSTRRCS